MPDIQFCFLLLSLQSSWQAARDGGDSKEPGVVILILLTWFKFFGIQQVRTVLCHSNVKFAIEFEQDNAISFLDILVTGNQNNTDFHDIHLPKETFHRSLHEVGFLHSTKV